MGNFDTGVSESRVLSFREKSKIVDALLECPHIRDRDSRKTVLDSLNDQIPGIIDAIPLVMTIELMLWGLCVPACSIQ